MPHRAFTDSAGRTWDVWVVHPSHVERRKADGDGDGKAQQPVVERRTRREFRVPLEGKFVTGWLCFETRGEKRRLAPFPREWMQMTDRELERLLREAAEAPRRPRRLIE